MERTEGVAVSTGAMGVTGRRMSRDDAFLLPSHSVRATAGALDALLQARRSTRHYDGQPLENETIDRLLAMASTARIGFPPAEVGVVVINGKERVQELAADIIEARKQNRDRLFYEAPCVLLFHYPMKDPIDSTIACSFGVVAAEALGLGSCIIGTVPAALQNDKKPKAKWGIPSEHHPRIPMILGYPSARYRRGIRRRFASVQYL